MLQMVLEEVTEGLESSASSALKSLAEGLVLKHRPYHLRMQALGEIHLACCRYWHWPHGHHGQPAAGCWSRPDGRNHWVLQERQAWVVEVVVVLLFP